MFDYDFVSLGGYVLDLYVPVPELPIEPDRTYRVFGQKIEQEAGGSVGNVTIMASRLGLKTASVGYLGRDPHGRHILDTFKAEGIDVKNVELAEGLQTPLVIVLADAKGKHAYVTNLHNGNIIRFAENWKLAIKNARLFYVTGYSLLEEGASRVVLETMKFANENGVKIIFDPGPLISQLQGLPQALALCDILIPNEQEARMISETESTWQAIEKLHGEYDKDLIIVKLGAKGCLMMEKGNKRIIHDQGFQVEKVVDTTAAGDCFAAAVAKGFLNDEPMEEIAKFANAVGAAAVQKLGSGRKVPTLEEVMAVYG